MSGAKKAKPGVGWVSIFGLLLIAAVSLPQASAAIPQELVAETNGLSVETKTDDGETDTWRFDLSVIDTDGKAVPNASVYLDAGKIRLSGQVKIGKHLETSRKGDAYQCNDQGELSIDFPTKPNQLQVLFEMDGYGPYLARWVHPSQANQIPNKFTAQVERAWTIGGTVIDENGNPVKDAEIQFYLRYKRRPNDVSISGKVSKVKTDEDGRWLFRQIPNSLYFVDDAKINHPAFQLKTLKLTRPKFEISLDSGNQTGGTITLSKGLMVSGRVVNEQGEAIVGATIRTVSYFDERTAISGEDGRYTIIGCQPEAIDLVATSPGMAIELNRGIIEPKSKDIDFVLKPSKGIRVRVVNEAGKPLAGSRVTPAGWSGSGITHWVTKDLRQFADENGVWEWKEAPLVEVTAFIGAGESGWEETPLDEYNVLRTPEKEVFLGPVKLLPREQEYIITVPTKSFLSGKVTDAVTGEKLESFRVIPGRTAEERRSWFDWGTVFGSGGNYRIPYTRQLHNADFIRIEAVGYHSAISRDVKSDEGDVTLDFKLEPAEMTTTQIVDADGQPVFDAVVVYATEESNFFIRNGHLDFSSMDNSLQLKTDDQGNVEFTNRSEPFLLLILHDRGFARVASEEMTVPKQIKLTEWSVLEGSYSVGQEPSIGIDVLVEAEGLEVRRNGRKGIPNIYARYSGKTNSNGNFRFDRVVPGNNYVGHKKYAGESHVSGVFKRYVAVAGETQNLQLGGKGVPIVGRMLPPKDLDGSKILMNAKLHLTPQKSKDDTGESNSDLFFKTTAKEDGSFRIDDVPSGDWVLTSSHRIPDGPNVISDPIKITVTNEDQGEKNIGDLITKEKS